MLYVFWDKRAPFGRAGGRSPPMTHVSHDSATKKYIFMFLLDLWESESWKRDLNWRPPKNTLLLWEVFIGFCFVWISQKLQYFFYGFWFLYFFATKNDRFWDIFVYFWWWFLNMIYDHAPFGGTIGGASRRHGMPNCYKNICFIKSEDLRIWEFWEKGIDLDTPKKYTFALVEEKWVFKYRDFSKIAVLFLWILSFCVFCNKKWSILRYFLCFYMLYWKMAFRSASGAKRRHAGFILHIIYRYVIHNCDYM